MTGTTEPAHYASFIVRLWRDPAPEDTEKGQRAWMCELESIQTGRAWSFQGLEPLLQVLAAQLAAELSASDRTAKQP